MYVIGGFSILIHFNLFNRKTSLTVTFLYQTAQSEVVQFQAFLLTFLVISNGRLDIYSQKSTTFLRALYLVSIIFSSTVTIVYLFLWFLV